MRFDRISSGLAEICDLIIRLEREERIFFSNLKFSRLSQHQSHQYRKTLRREGMHFQRYLRGVKEIVGTWRITAHSIYLITDIWETVGSFSTCMRETGTSFMGGGGERPLSLLLLRGSKGSGKGGWDEQDALRQEEDWRKGKKKVYDPNNEILRGNFTAK